MSLIVSAQIVEARRAVMEQLRALQQRARETGTEQRGDVKSQLKALLAKASELRQKADDEFLDHQIKSLESEWRAEGDPMPPDVGGKRGAGADLEVRRTQLFHQALRHGVGSLTREEYAQLAPQGEMRTVLASQDSKGGYLILPKFGASVLDKLQKTTFIRQKADIETLTDAGSLGYPTIETDPDDLTWTTELKTIQTDNSLAFGKRELKPHPVRKRIFVSQYALMNSPYSPDQIVEKKLLLKLGFTQENAYLLGNGTGQPLGVMTPTPQGVSTNRDMATGNTGTNITYTGLVKAKFHMDEQWRNGAGWMFPTEGIEQLSLLVDGHGRPIWREGLAPGEPDSLLGLPLTENQFMPSVFTTGQYVGLLANWAYYKIVDVVTMPIRRIDDVHYETDQVAFLVNYWGDGMPIWEDAFVRVKLG